MKKILALDPPGSGQQVVHLLAETGDVTHALCGKNTHYPREGERVVKRRAVWQVRKFTEHDWICLNCERVQQVLDCPPVALPCTNPEAPVVLWVRGDGKRDTLIHSCGIQESVHSRCGVKNTIYYSGRWKSKAGRARDITCQRCLKAEGWYEGHPRHEHETRQQQAEAKAVNIQTLFNDWLAFTGEYHRTDPRATQ